MMTLSHGRRAELVMTVLQCDASALNHCLGMNVMHPIVAGCYVAPANRAIRAQSVGRKYDSSADSGGDERQGTSGWVLEVKVML